MLNLRFLKEKKLPLIDAYAIHLWFVLKLEKLRMSPMVSVLKHTKMAPGYSTGLIRFYRNKKKQ